MIPFSIAGLQMPVAAGGDNLSAMRHRLDVLMARYPWVQMALFSELAPLGPLPRFAQPVPGPAEASLQEMAAKHGIWLIPGSLYERTAEGLIYNTAPVIDPAGRIVTRYRKMFPFRPYEEGIAAGTSFCLFDVPEVGRFGVSICYDIWFPETTRSLTALGAEVLLHPVLTGTIDREIELSIARATAAQFQCYVFDINGIGAGGLGRSCVIDPAGQVLHQAGGQEEMIPIEIDMEQVRRQRETGLRGLGQVLKSFRDRPADFPVYDRAAGADGYLATLGPLGMPARGSLAAARSPHTQPAIPPGTETGDGAHAFPQQVFAPLAAK
jgi:deaminated glutathione amidase